MTGVTTIDLTASGTMTGLAMTSGTMTNMATIDQTRTSVATLDLALADTVATGPAMRVAAPLRAVEADGRAAPAREPDDPAPPRDAGSLWFEAEVRPHFQTLYRYGLRMTHDPDAADDLVQDTLERGYRKRALFQPGTDLRAWLLQVMRNVWITGHRRRAHDPGTVSLDALEEEPRPLAVRHEVAGVSVVETSVVDRLGETAILAAIAALPPLYRDVVMLADVHDVPYKRIAEIVRIPVGSVCSRLSRGRERVRRTLLDQHHDTGSLARAG
jgi:RNA polymerase sigma-70 factor (ECF subfamily)